MFKSVKFSIINYGKYFKVLHLLVFRVKIHIYATFYVNEPDQINKNKPYCSTMVDYAIVYREISSYVIEFLENEHQSKLMTTKTMQKV